MKTVLFVPGFKEDIDSRNYKKVLYAIESRGYRTKFITIDWERTTLNDWTRQLEEQYFKYNPEETILAGFSFGSVTALYVAARRNPEALWLFSLSPYFAEDLPNLRSTHLRDIGKKREKVFAGVKFASLASLIKCPTLVLAGEIEMRKYDGVIGTRFEDAKRKFLNVNAISVSAAEHDVTDDNYINAIIENI